jgi:hypothetical protein
MQTSIYISGQISGNLTLMNAIKTFDSETKKEFNNYKIIFKTKKEAKKALWAAYQYLRCNEPEFNGINYSKHGSMRYDASTATIID